MNKNDLEKLYNTYKLKELVKILKCSVPTIYQRLKEYDIPRKGQGKGERTRKKLIIEE